jgi:hypothetical protein
MINLEDFMNFKQLVGLLSDHKDKGIRFAFSDKSYIPNHFHITEVGRVQKDFVDCGGVAHKSSSCVLQTWVADDVEHRLKADKLLEILNKANSLLDLNNESVEIEYEGSVISQYKIAGFEDRFQDNPSEILFHLIKKHTACLAPDKCLPKKGCCGDKKGCC